MFRITNISWWYIDIWVEHTKPRKAYKQKINFCLFPETKLVYLLPVLDCIFHYKKSNMLIMNTCFHLAWCYDARLKLNSLTTSRGVVQGMPANLVALQVSFRSDMLLQLVIKNFQLQVKFQLHLLLLNFRKDPLHSYPWLTTVCVYVFLLICLFRFRIGIISMELPYTPHRRTGSTVRFRR